jgi:CheY-like chemotaxis protein
VADILIVDDNVDLALTLGDLLTLYGHTVRVAYDGIEGLAAVDERFPDVVVLDVEMPKLDGPGMATRMILQDVGRENIPIVLASGLVELLDVAAHVGTPYAVPKPSPPDTILGVVRRALAERTAPRPPRSPRMHP